MHVTVTRVNTADQPVSASAIVAEEMERWLREIDGFEGLMMLANETTTLGLAFWRTSELAERNRPLRREFLDRMMAVAGVEVEEIVDYTLAFSRVDPTLADPAG